ncbi:MAG: hypothetical protein U1E49_08965 [Hyphomicrobiaceae bacterium]
MGKPPLVAAARRQHCFNESGGVAENFMNGVDRRIKPLSDFAVQLFKISNPAMRRLELDRQRFGARPRDGDLRP